MKLKCFTIALVATMLSVGTATAHPDGARNQLPGRVRGAAFLAEDR